jgi:hypothetical protein
MWPLFSGYVLELESKNTLASRFEENLLNRARFSICYGDSNITCTIGSFTVALNTLCRTKFNATEWSETGTFDGLENQTWWKIGDVLRSSVSTGSRAMHLAHPWPPARGIGEPSAHNCSMCAHATV